SPVVPRRRVMILAPGQPIPYRRPYRYHLTGPLHMLTARKRVRPLPNHRLVVRNFVDHSSSDYFSPDDSARDSSSNSSSEASVRDSDYLADVEVNPKESSEPSRYRGTDIRVDDHIERIDKSYSEHEIDPMQAIIEACFDFADIIRSRGIDVRVVAETVARDEIRTDTRKEQHKREQGRRIVGVESVVIALTKRIAKLERDNRSIRGTMPNTQSGESMTHEEIEDLVSRRVAEEIEARNGGNRNGVNGGIGNRGNGENGNGNGGRNGNGNHGMNYGGTEGVVGLTSWFEKIETVFNISNCPSKYQVKYATCTLQDSALTWWNSHKRTIGVDDAYAIKWAELIKLMTRVYFPRNEIQKMETELWNLIVKGNDLTAYTQRFQELILLCSRMVPDEEDRVERFIGGLPDNIQGNVIAANPVRLQYAIRIANQLMDKKLQGYAARSAENKRRMESNPRDKHGQQPPFNRQNVSGQNVARTYTTGNNERR
ncbi:putative reverse transcriptase domain-containing protein, partial [Tanacetum coccineum]